jgi:putative endonuclease
MDSWNEARRVKGLQAEAEVCKQVKAWGWRVLGHNVRQGHYEIDIVAREHRTLVIIEVRLRGPGSLTSGFGSISAYKRRCVRFAGERLWQSRYRYDDSLDHVRFDAASVHIDPAGAVSIEYSKAAF